MSPSISASQSQRETEALAEAIDAAERRRDRRAAVGAYRAALAHPCAEHAFEVPELWADLAEAYKALRLYDDAIAAMQSAVAAGHRSWPHPDADIAELHLLAGRHEVGEALFASLRSRTPDDIWLYNAAGFSFADIGDHESAVAWFSEGIDLGMRTGNPEGVVGQMNEARTASLQALGRAPDEVAERAARFVNEWQEPAPGTWTPPDWPGEGPPPERPCGHCGWRPDRPSWAPTLDRPLRIVPHAPEAVHASMAVAWFPSEQWQAAIGRWPDLLDELPEDHAAYSREIQRRIMTIGHGTASRLSVAPMTVEGLLDYCAGRDDCDPGSAAARAAYAAELLRTGQARRWPPGRNEPCWCGSGRKYKVCCGTVTLHPQP